MALSALVPAKNTDNYRQIYTSFAGNLPLNKAVDATIAIDADNNAKAQSYSFNALTELLLTDIDNASPAEQYQLSVAYNYFKQLLAQMLQNSNNTKQLISTLLKVEQHRGTCNNNSKNIDAQLIIDMADAYIMAGDFNMAINYLEKMALLSTGTNLSTINNAICRANVMHQLHQNPNLPTDLQQMLSQCQECNAKNKSGQINNNNNEQTNVPESINNLELVIMPNPVTQQSVINVKGATGARINVYNNIGQAVINNIIDESNYIYNIGHTQLKTGIYLVTVRQNGQTITSQKMVITK